MQMVTKEPRTTSEKILCVLKSQGTGQNAPSVAVWAKVGYIKDGQGEHYCWNHIKKWDWN